MTRATADSDVIQPWSLGCTALLVGALALSVALSPRELVYDETYHLASAQLLGKHGLLQALQLESQSAAGPLYPVVHLVLSPLTGLSAPWVRIVNVAILLGCGFLLARIVRTFVGPQADRMLLGDLLAVPFIYPAAGMALTEMPAMVAFAAALLALLRAFRLAVDSPGARSLGWSLLAGGFVGLAVLGRQPYLVVPLVSIALMPFVGKHWRWLAVMGLTAFLTSSWLWIVWGGLVPPGQERIEGHALSLGHAGLSLGYLAVATLFIRPKWIVITRESALAGLIAAALVAVSATNGLLPGQTAIQHLLPDAVVNVVAFIAAPALTGLGVVWAVCALRDCWACWTVHKDRYRLCVLAFLLALAVTPAAILHQFSSRYVVGALPCLLIALRADDTSDPESPASLVRRAVGGTLGLILLWSYY